MKVEGHDLAKATPSLPVFLGEKDPFQNKSTYSYFYNGRALYAFHGLTCRSLPGLDVNRLQWKPYGLCDDASVVVGLSVLRTNPKKFKRVGKYGHYYFWRRKAFTGQSGSCRPWS
ncbi:hypothetical protein CAI21_15125 [Alkalilimnicola ehrlichii]|uniref:hypothetical protein n=1 Tax=Alkalilimnicola ehrlichii TaxID=351052 RepID=UPI000E2EFF14|nr:hypothetical protein [Alkalilimnicola ehrlichii]RFA27180.1 hypothetical protein CAI21_15125 [Alkalilimnicola ehrlichii]